MSLSVKLFSIYKRASCRKFLLFQGINDEEESGGKSGSKVLSENQDIDLYEVHDFDIKLDIDIPEPEIGRSVSAGLI